MSPSTLPTVLTPQLMALVSEHPQLPAHSWYIIAAATLTMLNRPDEIPRIYEHAITLVSGRNVSRPDLDNDTQLTILRRMREAMKLNGLDNQFTIGPQGCIPT
jgi:hypothetical protein